jgi:hypothetical protein
METGLLAAEAIDRRTATTTAHAPALRGALRALKPRFALYEKAAHVNHRPWLTDLVIWRARRSPRILRRMSGVLEETQNPAACSAGAASPGCCSNRPPSCASCWA